MTKRSHKKTVSSIVPTVSNYTLTIAPDVGYALTTSTSIELSIGECPDEPSDVLGTTVTEEPDGEVLGVTVTTVPEVLADTLPFTGSESGHMVKLAMLALLAGALMLFAVRGPKENEGTSADLGGWSSL